jgi:hypothetical protein
MNRIPFPILIASALLIQPALAHPGDHSQFSWSALAAHLFEPDHLIFAALTIAVGFLAFRAGRRAERRANDRSKQ